MNAVILIPARYQSTRYPGKPLVELKGASGAAKPLIQRSVEAARRVAGVSGVFVLTDDARIADACTGFGVGAIMTSPECRNGTERCAEALAQLHEPDVVINFQGDALLTPPGFVEALIARMATRQRGCGRDARAAAQEHGGPRPPGRGGGRAGRRNERRHRCAAALRSISRSG